MPWIKDKEKNTEYWFPDKVPEKTEEHNKTQAEKRYLDNHQEKRIHPRWHYDNGAFVDDDYLFYNEGWKLILDDLRPEIPEEDLIHTVENPLEDWEEVDGKTLRVTYTLVNFTEEEVESCKIQRWEFFRMKRNNLLLETDFAFVRALESGLIVSNELKVYRQQLRDFPETITDIVKFNIADDSLWPTKPEKFFED